MDEESEPAAQPELIFAIQNEVLTHTVVIDSEIVAEPAELPRAESESLRKRLPPLSSSAESKPDTPVEVMVDAGLQATCPDTSAATLELIEVERSRSDEGSADGIASYGPVGEVPAARQVSVMISREVGVLGSDPPAELARIEPPVDGRWRWLDVRCLVFEPEAGRFPQSSTFTVTVDPANVGIPDASLVTWSFNTPTIKVKRHSPQGKSVDLMPIVLIEFDQPIDVAAVEEKLRFKAEKANRVEFRRATQDEITGNRHARRIQQAVDQSRAIAVLPCEPLQRATRYQVSLPKGNYAAEGDRKSEKAFGFSFTTFERLSVVKHTAGYGRRSESGDPLQIEFNHDLDRERIEKDLIRVDPPIDSLAVEIHGSSIHIDGRTLAHVDYTVTLPGDLADQFGQTLGKPVELHFKIDRVRRSLETPWEFGNEFVIATPDRLDELCVWASGISKLDVTVFQVTPENWTQYGEHCKNQWNKKAPPIPGTIVHEESITLNSDRESQPVQLDIRKALHQSLGHAIVQIKVPGGRKQEQIEETIWVQVTRLGVTATGDNERIIARVSSLPCLLIDSEVENLSHAISKPVPHAEVRFDRGPASSGQTDQDGLVSLPIVPEGEKEPRVMLATVGDDTTFLPLRGGYNRQIRTTPSDKITQVHWWVVCDRQLYRPGETVQVKGLVRFRDQRALSPLRVPEKCLATLRLHAKGKELLKERLEILPDAGFDFSVSLPADMPLGKARIEIRINGWGDGLEGRRHDLDIRVEEFRRPEFEVKVEMPATVTQGQEIRATATASYFGGGGAAGAECRWKISAQKTRFNPAGHDQFSFGEQDARWFGWYDDTDDFWGKRNRVSMTLDDTTDASGKTSVAGRLEHPSEVFQPYRVKFESQVQDLDRQWQSGTATVLIHPSAWYVGLSTRSQFVRSNQPIDFSLIVVDPDGHPCEEAEVTVQLYRVDWNDRWVESRPIDEQSVQVTGGVTSGTFRADQAGSYRLIATVTDKQRRRQRSSLTLWVAGGRGKISSTRDEKTPSYLIADRTEYKPGDVAKLLLVSQLETASGIALIRASGIVRYQPIEVKNYEAMLEVPIESQMCPDITVQAELVGRETDDQLPAYISSAHTKLSIDTESFALPVRVSASPDPARPGGTTQVTIAVDGLPENHAAVYTLMVVDDAILSLAGYRWPELRDTFFAQRIELLGCADSRVGWLHPNPMPEQQPEGIVWSKMSASGEGLRSGGTLRKARSFHIGGFTGSSNLTSYLSIDVAPESDDDTSDVLFSLRENFGPLAKFVAVGALDEFGRASLEVNLPDTATRYRVMAAVWSGHDHFGNGSATFDTMQPLVLRPSLPRHLVVDDEVELSLVVENQNDIDLTVNAVANAEHVTIQSPGKRLTVPARSRREVRFQGKAASAGEAQLNFAAETIDGSCSDAVHASLPVRRGAASTAVATYGQIQASETGRANSCLLAPLADAFESKVTVSIAASAVAKLADIFLVLKDYEFDCAEQVASRMIAYCTVAPILRSFDCRDVPREDDILAQLGRDLNRLADRQNKDGGFPFWRRGDRSSPIASLRVAHAMAAIKSSPLDMGNVRYEASQLLSRLGTYAGQLPKKLPSWYSSAAKQYLIAYRYHLAGRIDRPGFGRIKELRGEMLGWIKKQSSKEPLNPESVALLLPCLRDEPELSQPLTEQLISRVDQTAATATLALRVDASDQHALLQTHVATDATVLIALLTTQPEHPLVVKFARGLLEAKTGRRYSTTYECGWVLEGLAKFVQEREAADPDCIGRVWLDPNANDSAQSGPQQWIGKPLRSRTESHSVSIPLAKTSNDPSAESQQVDPARLTVSATGVGTTYWSARMQSRTPPLQTPPLDQGIRVERWLRSIDDDQLIDPDGDQIYQLQAGTLVQCDVRIVVPARRHHIALVSPLPAGCEALPPQRPDKDDSREPLPWWLRRTWYDHFEQRDASVQVFAAIVPAGVFKLRHTMQVTSVGNFLWPAAWCEEMYRPETFGRSVAGQVCVQPRESAATP